VWCLAMKIKYYVLVVIETARNRLLPASLRDIAKCGNSIVFELIERRRWLSSSQSCVHLQYHLVHSLFTKYCIPPHICSFSIRLKKYVPTTNVGTMFCEMPYHIVIFITTNIFISSHNLFTLLAHCRACIFRILHNIR